MLYAHLLSEYILSGQGNMLVYNVKDYGATGNGTTDDTVAIQAAYNAATTNHGYYGNGATVFFPPGTYLVSSTIHIGTFATNSAQTCINTLGSGSLNTMILWGGLANSTVVLLDGVKNYRFIGVGVINYGGSGGVTGCVGIGIYSTVAASGVISLSGDFQDVFVQYFDTGVWVGKQGNDCSETTFLNLYVADCTTNGIFCDGQNTFNITFINCSINGNATGFYSYRSSHIHFVGGSSVLNGVGFNFRTGDGLFTCRNFRSEHDTLPFSFAMATITNSTLILDGVTCYQIVGNPQVGVNVTGGWNLTMIGCDVEGTVNIAGNINASPSSLTIIVEVGSNASPVIYNFTGVNMGDPTGGGNPYSGGHWNLGTLADESGIYNGSGVRVPYWKNLNSQILGSLGGNVWTQNPQPSTLLNGLSAFWELNGTLNDDSPNGLTLSYITSPPVPYAAGILNNAFAASHSSGNLYVLHADNPLLQAAAGGYGGMFWYKCLETGTTHQLMGKGAINNTSNCEYQVYKYTDDKIYFDSSNGSIVEIGTAAACVTNTWYCVQFYYDPVSAKLYLTVNGTTTSISFSGSPVTSNQPLNIGYNTHGLIEQVGFWQRPFVAAELTAFYQAGAPTITYPFLSLNPNTAPPSTDLVPYGVVAFNGTTKTLTIADANTTQVCNNAGNQTITIPPDSTTLFEVNDKIVFELIGSGANLTIQGGFGVTVNGSVAGSRLLTSQYRQMIAHKIAANTWVVVN